MLSWTLVCTSSLGGAGGMDSTMGQKSFQFSLSLEDLQLLTKMLNVRLEELRMELARTEQADFKHALHKDIDSLEEILSQLERLSAKGAA